MDRESLQSANRRHLTFLQTLTAPLVEALKKLFADKTMSVAKAVQGVQKAGYQSTSRRFGGSQKIPTGSDVLQDADLRQTLASQGCCSGGRPAGDYVIEDDLRALAQPVLHHRLIFRNHEASRTALQHIVDQEVNRLAKMGIQSKP